MQERARGAGGLAIASDAPAMTPEPRETPMLPPLDMLFGSVPSAPVTSLTEELQ